MGERMGRTIKIFIACGSGIATSTVAEKEVYRIAHKLKIQVRISKGTIAEIPYKQFSVDLICLTANLKMDLKKPCMSLSGLVSGIKKEKAEAEVEKMLLLLAKR